MAKEKTYTVRLNRETFSVPRQKGLEVGGVIYRRGGYAFEANTIHTVSEKELAAFKIQLPRQFKNKEVVHPFDPHLLIEEIGTPRGKEEQ